MPDTVARSVTPLRTGTLSLEVSSAADGFGPLYRIAERQNPRRAFLFVSTVLGRHIPVLASKHAAVLDGLADQILPYLPEDGPVLVMSYAETAVGLGAGVWRALARSREGLAAPCAFLPTTRHAIPDRNWLAFSEDHSHAQHHLVLRPDPDVLDLALSSATLVLVDDETTTGQTFSALARELCDATPGWVSRIVLATLTDWSDDAAVAGVRAATGVEDVASVSLLSGRWEWSPAENAPAISLPPGRLAECLPWNAPAGRSTWRAPRLGLPTVEPFDLASLYEQGLATPKPGERWLVIGTGEHVWAAFLAAEALERSGAEAAFLATTRSPILPGPAIDHRAVFPDHYGIGLEMYLHNVDPSAWDKLLVLCEPGPSGMAQELRRALGPCAVVDENGDLAMLGA